MLDDAHNLGKVTRFPAIHSIPRDDCPCRHCRRARRHSEPTNEQLGIEPWQGWRVVVAWSFAWLFGYAILAFAAWLIYKGIVTIPAVLDTMRGQW